LTVEIWTQKECPLCENVKAKHGEGNYVEHDVKDLMSGANQDMDAMVQLTMQNMVLPLVMIDGKWDVGHIG